MTKWEYTSTNLMAGESWYDELRRMGKEGWEAWHMEHGSTGHREIYFKRPITDANQR